MFLGDTRIIKRVLGIVKQLQPKYAIIDGTHIVNNTPSTEESFAQFYYVLRKMRGKIFLGFAHTGTVLLCQLLDIKVAIGGPLPPFVETLLNHLNLVSKDSDVVAVSIRDERANLVPSSLYYVHNHIDTAVVKQKKKTRVFVSFHTSNEEVQTLKTIVPNVEVI